MLASAIPDIEITCYDLFAFSCVEGMVQRSLDDFAIDGQIGNMLVVVNEHMHDLMFLNFTAFCAIVPVVSTLW